MNMHMNISMNINMNKNMNINTSANMKMFKTKKILKSDVKLLQ